MLLRVMSSVTARRTEIGLVQEAEQRAQRVEIAVDVDVPGLEPRIEYEGQPKMLWVRETLDVLRDHGPPSRRQFHH